MLLFRILFIFFLLLISPNPLSSFLRHLINFWLLLQQIRLTVILANQRRDMLIIVSGLGSLLWLRFLHIANHTILQGPMTILATIFL